MSDKGNPINKTIFRSSILQRVERVTSFSAHIKINPYLFHPRVKRELGKLDYDLEELKDEMVLMEKDR